MFVNSEHLPQRLRSEHYTSQAYYDEELRKLFVPGWHCIACLSQLPNAGDFRTIEVLGRPLICWHTSTGFRTYLNICTHRFSTLTDQPQGRCPGHLKCQYHGWEFDEAGNTCRIPDAQSFRPLSKGELGLREYRTEMVGQLVFFTFDENAPTVREYLGDEIVSLCEQWFGPNSRIVYLTNMELGCNWKIAMENVVESYHINSVHAKSFGQYPRQEECSHTFHQTYDHFVHDYRQHARDSSTWRERLIARLSGTQPELRYHNLLRYPNMLLGKGAQVGYIQMYWPVTINSCRNFSIFMDQTGERGSWISGLIHRLIRFGGKDFIRQILNEDAAIYPSIHRGTVSPDRPYGGGLISIREERIFALQERILSTYGELEAGHRTPAEITAETVPTV